MRCSPLWLVLLTLAVPACRGTAPATVERIMVSDSFESDQLKRLGIGREVLGGAVSASFDASRVFVRAERAGASARRYVAQVKVVQAEAIAPTTSASAIALVTVAIDLTPGDGGASLRETGRAAEPIGEAPGAVRSAFEGATKSALGRAVDGLVLAAAAEGKTTRQLEQDLRAAEPSVRMHALRAIGDRGDHGAVLAVAACLDDPEPEVVERAVGTLAQLRDPRAVPALIALTHHREGPYVAAVARILGDIGGADARAWLLTMASGHPDEAVRGAAREALTDLAGQTQPSSKRQ